MEVNKSDMLCVLWLASVQLYVYVCVCVCGGGLECKGESVNRREVRECGGRKMRCTCKWVWEGGCVCVRSVSHTICCLFSGVWEAEGGCAESTK